MITRVFVATLMLVPALATALVYGVGGNLAINGDAHGRHAARAGTLLLRLSDRCSACPTSAST